jgi:hypothetical protein
MIKIIIKNLTIINFYFIYRIILVALNAFQIHGKEVKKNGNIFKMKRIAINVAYLISTKMKKYI